ncbi:hypothetical protein ACWEOE_13965 [Amycolatopsis sp. NPDC004368]
MRDRTITRSHNERRPPQPEDSVDQNESRHRRRAGNQAARPMFAEARRAGLVRRHLLKLRYLADHPRQHGETAPTPFPVAGTPRKRRKPPEVQLAFDFADQPERRDSHRTVHFGRWLTPDGRRTVSSSDETEGRRGVDVEQVRAAAVEPYLDGVPVLRVVDVVGRRSGEARPVVLNVTRLGGNHYACAPDGRGWIRNLLAAGYCRVERDGPEGRDTVRRVQPVHGEEAGQALKAQRSAAIQPPGQPTTVLRLDPLV